MARVALVTGGTRGIGAAISKALESGKDRSAPQNALGNPASFSTLLAVCTLTVLRGMLKRRLVMGLYQISWEPLP